MVSATIIESDTSPEMLRDLKKHNIKINNKLLLRVGYILIVDTVYNVLDSDVDECILILNNDVDKISEVVLEQIRDDRLKIISSKEKFESKLLLIGNISHFVV